MSSGSRTRQIAIPRLSRVQKANFGLLSPYPKNHSKKVHFLNVYPFCLFCSPGEPCLIHPHASPTVNFRIDASSSLGRCLCTLCLARHLHRKFTESVGRAQLCRACWEPQLPSPFPAGQKYDTFRCWLLSIFVEFLLPESSLVKVMSSVPTMVPGDSRCSLNTLQKKKGV